MKKPKANCANPLLVEWLGEWLEEQRALAARGDARAQNLQHVYKKAQDSMAMYPLPLPNGFEATVVKGIGPLIAKRLDDRMKAYNSTVDAREQSCAVADPPATARVSQFNKPTTQRSNSSSSLLASQLSSIPDIDTNTAQNKSRKRVVEPETDLILGEANQSKPKKPRAPSTKEYVPQFRSGPYAILITLHTKTKSGEFMSKNEIIKLGQNLCESSFDVPAAGKQYTAWASMKLLVDRGLVFASGRPARYTITQEGRELAGRLMTATDNQRKQGGSSINVAITSRHSSPTEDEGTLTDEDDATRDRRAGVSDPLKLKLSSVLPKEGGSKSKGPNQELQIALDGAAIRNPLNNLSKLTQNQQPPRPTLNQTQQIPKPFQQPKTSKPAEQSTKPDSAVITAQISRNTIDTHIPFVEPMILDLISDEDRNMDDRVWELHSSGSDLGSSQRSVSDVYSSQAIGSQASAYSNFISEFNLHSNIASSPPRALPTRPSSSLQPSSSISLFLSSEPNTTWMDTIPRNPSSQRAVTSSNSKPNIPAAPFRRQISDIHTSTPPASSSSLSRLVAFEKGTFYIEVVIDNREVRSRSNREYIQQKLQERGLKVSTRVLQLGDFMWVARKKDAQRPDEVNDIVLDYIIERKTMTDLTSSIKDGRFKEQKFRLSNCGVSNVIYLVEKDDMTMANAFGIQSIRSAIAMTQICDGFFVKETSNTDESIEYIARMTTRLNDIYKDRAIYAVHACDMSPELRPKLQHRGQYDNTNRSNDTPKGLDGNALHITYEAFSEANGKKTNFTRRDLWIRQLMTIRGISAEKASSIAKVFPTMQSLISAYNVYQGDKTQMVKSDGPGRSAIGKVLAAKLAEMFA